MSSDLDRVDVHFISANSRITYDSKIKQFLFFGSSDIPYQSIIYINVSFKTKTDLTILIAYTSPNKFDGDTECILSLICSRQIFADTINLKMSKESSVDTHEIVQPTKATEV